MGRTRLETAGSFSFRWFEIEGGRRRREDARVDSEGHPAVMPPLE